MLACLPVRSAHYPLQAREEDIAKYRGKYKKGWDRIRQQRFQRQKELGVIPTDCTLSPPEDNINEYRRPFRGNIYKYHPWNTLSDKERDELDLEMAVFAAMVDCVDQNIRRIIKKLEDMATLDNTLILFFSDNGACPYDSNKDFSAVPGGPNSYRSLCAAWANVGDTPFRFYKQYGHEGGCRTHFIAHWPKVISPSLCHQPAHLVDIYPTLLELSGGEYPTSVDSGPTPRLDGQSLVPLFKGGTREVPNLLISGYSGRFRMIRSGDWKIVKANNGPWRLYNMRQGATELNDLAGKMPERVAKLEKLYEDYGGKKTGPKKEKKQ